MEAHGAEHGAMDEQRDDSTNMYRYLQAVCDVILIEFVN